MVSLKLQQSNQGSVLVIGLIIMLVLVMLGVSALNFSALTEKITGNQRNKDFSLQAAESSLRDGELWIANQTDIPTASSTCTGLPCSVWITNTLPDLVQQNQTWWSSTARTISSTIPLVSSQPLYIIEEHSFVAYELDPDARSKGKGYFNYKITSRGVGLTNDAQSILESIYTVQYK